MIGMGDVRRGGSAIPLYRRQQFTIREEDIHVVVAPLVSKSFEKYEVVVVPLPLFTVWVTRPP